MSPVQFTLRCSALRVVRVAVAACVSGLALAHSACNGSDDDASCSEVCANVGRLCGDEDVADCNAECPSATVAQRNCVANATDCKIIEDCLFPEDGESDEVTNTDNPGCVWTSCTTGAAPDGGYECQGNSLYQCVYGSWQLVITCPSLTSDGYACTCKGGCGTSTAECSYAFNVCDGYQYATGWQ